MDAQLVVLCGLTFLIHFVATLAYAVRIAGVRTRRIAVSFALFNLLVLVSRTSNAFQAPLLAKRVEHHLAQSLPASLLGDFRWLLVAASVATAVAACFIPTFQRVFYRAVLDFQEHRSLPRMASVTALAALASAPLRDCPGTVFWAGWFRPGHVDVPRNDAPFSLVLWINQSC